jgi:mannose-1-phosphate guanylyltransferase
VSNLYALIIAGGRGTRFWPCSRRQHPKQCISIGGQDAMLQQTIQRLLPLVPAERILVITGSEMADSVREVSTDLPSENILVEPWGRNTAPCIGWGAVEVGRREANPTLAVFPSDHKIGDPENFRSVVRGAAEAAKATNALATIGISPSRAETGFGYLEVGVEVGSWGGHAFRTVERFTEKPDPETAQRYLDGQRHLWNAGMFVFTTDAIRDAYRAFLPRSAAALERIQHSPNTLQEQWGELDATSIDYGIMERARHILTVPADFGWSDMGSWQAAAEEMPSIPGGRGTALHVIAKDAKGNVIHSPNKVVALLGVRDLVVVDTPDALLIMDASRAQQVGEIVRRLEDDALQEFT